MKLDVQKCGYLLGFLRRSTTQKLKSKLDILGLRNLLKLKVLELLRIALKYEYIDEW